MIDKYFKIGTSTLRNIMPFLIIVLAFFLFPDLGLSQESAVSENPIDTGDTAWMFVSSAIVLMMTIPGLFLFYGGLVRSKNALGTIMHCFFIVALISVQWVLLGYTIAFGSDISGIFGSLEFLGLNNVGPDPNPDLAATIPHLSFMMFQMTFAIITPALITGAFAERIKFSAFIIFILLWATIVYDPLAHWVWGGGWLGEMGTLDFAGGTVVHISSGAAALAAALIFGKRIGYGQQLFQPHNLPFSLIGASLLWIGWFGFNAGSALAADGIAAIAFVTANTAAAAAVLSWTFTEWLHRGKPTVLGAASGAIVGLVSITPAAGFVSPMAALIIGLVGGIICYFAVNLKSKLGYDDALDVVGIHGVGGTWGALATGLFASLAVNSGGNNGLFYGNPKQLWIQFVAVVATWIFVFVVTMIILYILKITIGIRVDSDEENQGLDLSQHNETSYNM